MLRITLLLSALWALIDAGSVNLCKDMKDCASCAESYIYVFGFREYCRWCAETASCGGPFACSTSSGVVQREPFMCPVPVPTAKGRRYTDKLGRSLFSLALAVKDTDPTICLANSRPDVK
ncbi:unnamed protein product [Gongylonema pulchrum]|uniref:Secreted protein n=1 Tax=Gongylonema pulchrum TaxID=637853 RepID=A0A183DCJ7_9BILA|nr:unnamed protein product [Gongylonema pulchrum]